MPQIDVRIKWDVPRDENWLNPMNLELALGSYCKNTHFEVMQLPLPAEFKVSYHVMVQVHIPGHHRHLYLAKENETLPFMPTVGTMIYIGDDELEFEVAQVVWHTKDGTLSLWKEPLRYECRDALLTDMELYEAEGWGTYKKWKEEFWEEEFLAADG